MTQTTRSHNNELLIETNKYGPRITNIHLHFPVEYLLETDTQKIDDIIQENIENEFTPRYRKPTWKFLSSHIKTEEFTNTSIEKYKNKNIQILHIYFEVLLHRYIYGKTPDQDHLDEDDLITIYCSICQDDLGYITSEEHIDNNPYVMLWTLDHNDNLENSTIVCSNCIELGYSILSKSRNNEECP